MKDIKSFKRVGNLVCFAFGALILFPQFLHGQEPLDGKTTIAAPVAAPENVLLGNISVARSTDKVAAAVYKYNSQIKSVVIYTPEQAEILSGYEKVRFQLKDLKIRYTDLRRMQDTENNQRALPACSITPGTDPNKISPGIAESVLNPVSDLIKSFINVTSFFRTNIELRPEVFTPDEEVVIAEVFRALRVKYGDGIELYNQTSIPPNFSDSELIREIQFVLGLDEDATLANSALEETLTQIACQSNPETFKARKLIAAGLIAKYEKYNGQLRLLLRGLTGELPEKEATAKAAGEKPEPTYLARYLAVENIYRLIRQNDGGYWLQIKPVKAGGTTRVKTNLIIDVFTGGNRVSHSGASLLEFNLYDKTGISVLSGIVTDYIPYTNPKKIPRLIDSSDEERLGKLPKKNRNTSTAKAEIQARPTGKN